MAFWELKLSKNQLRDERVKQQLAEAGWHIATVWECATRGKLAISHLPDLLDKLALWIRDLEKSPTLEIASTSLPALSGQSDEINKTL